MPALAWLKKQLSIPGSGRLFLALLIITAAFVMIGAMLYMEHSLITSAFVHMTDHPEIFTNKTHTENFRETVEKVQQSNMSFFNILLPVFGAWVGAVVAFYFGSEHLKQAQKTIEKLSKPTDLLATMTVEDLLNEVPDAKNVISFTIDDSTKMGDIDRKLDDPKLNKGPLLLIDENKKLLGLIYRTHLYEAAKEAAKKDKTVTFETFQASEFKANITLFKDDIITGKEWKSEGIKNFAELKLSDSLLAAQERMREISSSHPAVRGIVIEKETVKGIIDHDMIDHMALRSRKNV